MLHKETVDQNVLELLISLQNEPALRGFWLAGGTSLALQIGHRKSVDIYLFTIDPFDAQQMLEFLEEKFQFELDFSATNTLKGSINNIKVDILTHKYSLVCNIIHDEGVSLYSKEDIAAMKINAIAGNGTRSKDFIDIYFLLKYFTLSQIISFYGAKYKLRNEMHALKSLAYFNDVDLNDWPLLVLEQELTFSKIKKSISTHLKNYSNTELLH
jgi:hypothetical protein